MSVTSMFQYLARKPLLYLYKSDSGSWSLYAFLSDVLRLMYQDGKEDLAPSENKPRNLKLNNRFVHTSGIVVTADNKLSNDDRDCRDDSIKRMKMTSL